MAQANGFALDDKVALITGGSRGLGREIALAYADAGADVVIASRKLAACEELAAQINKRTGRRALPIQLHVGDWDSIPVAVDTVLDHFGRIDILVNNAGLSPLYDSLVDVTEALFDKVIDVNLKGAFRLCALVGAHMRDQGGGSIINVSSVAAERPTPVELPYAAAKAGMHAMTKGFAQAYGPTVRVNVIMPGPFLTDISHAWDMERAQKNLESYPLKRAGQPAEIVGAALFLASSLSSYTTGSVIAVDGGRTSRP